MSAATNAKDQINCARSLLHAAWEISKGLEDENIRDALCQVTDCATEFLAKADAALNVARADA